MNNILISFIYHVWSSLYFFKYGCFRTRTHEAWNSQCTHFGSKIILSKSAEDLSPAKKVCFLKFYLSFFYFLFFIYFFCFHNFKRKIFSYAHADFFFSLLPCFQLHDQNPACVPAHNTDRHNFYFLNPPPAYLPRNLRGKREVSLVIVIYYYLHTDRIFYFLSFLFFSFFLVCGNPLLQFILTVFWFLSSPLSPPFTQKQNQKLFAVGDLVAPDKLPSFLS